MPVEANKSILTSIKKMLGVSAEDDSFDQDITMHINAVFMILNQLGIGPLRSFFITDSSQLWDQFLTVNEDFGAIQSYMYLRVRLAFDPPTNSFLVESIKNQISEYEWRLLTQSERRIIDELIV